jgi:copper(I)-binding protein
VAISSPDFASIEIHRSVHENGTVKMVRQERLEVPADGSIVLESGGYHLMLMGRQRPLKEGDQVELLLTFDDGSTVELAAPVRKNTGAAGEHEHHH